MKHHIYPIVVGVICLVGEATGTIAVHPIAAILSARALPVLADLDPASFQLDPDEVERLITENTRAIMPVHMMGQPSHLERILAIARKHNLPVIEDAAQAHLAEYQGKKLGTIGTLGCFGHYTADWKPTGWPRREPR